MESVSPLNACRSNADNLTEMISIAKFRFHRVDLYDVKGKIYLGELTFYPASGMGKITPMD